MSHPVTTQPAQMETDQPSRDSPAGAEGGGTGTVDSPEQLSGFEETLQDDACKITISAKGSDGSIYEDTIEDIGLSVWFHLRQCGNLDSKLRTYFYEINKAQHGNITLTYVGSNIVSNSYFILHCKKIRQIFKETTESYCQVIILEDQKKKDFIVMNWTKTDLFQSRKATAHRAHSGCLIIVAEKSYRNTVDREVQKLKEQYERAMQLQDDGENVHAPEDKRNCSLQPDQHASCHLKWEPVQGLLKEDAEMVILETNIILTDCQQSFLSSRQEAQNYVVSCFEQHGITCAFDFNGRHIYLTAVKDVLAVPSQVLDDLVMSLTVPFSRVSWYSMNDLTNLLEERLKNSKGKFMVVKTEMAQNITVTATNDIFQDIYNVIHMVMVDVVVKLIELNQEQFRYLLLLKQWQEYDPLLVDVPTGVVLIRPVNNDNKCSILVVGKKTPVEEFYSETWGYFLSKTCECITLSDDKDKLLKTCQGAVKFIEQAVKEEGYEMQIRDNVVLLSDDISKFERSSSHYRGLILSKIIPNEEPMLKFFTLEELHDILDTGFKEYHDKLVVHVNKHEHCLTFTGTKDIFPAVVDQFEEIQASYKRVEQEVPLSPEMMEYFLEQDRSVIQKMTDDQRLRVTVNFKQEGEPRCIVTGPLIEVEKVKEWIHNICTEKEQKSVSMQTSELITLKELEHQLLKQSAFARDFVREAYEKENFGFKLDSMFRNAKVTVHESKDMPKAMRLLSSCLELFSVDFDQEQIHLSSKQAKDLLYRHQPDFSQRMFVLTKESDNMLSLIVTKDVATTVIRNLKQIMDDYAHDEVCLYLEPEEAGVVLKQLEKMKKEMQPSLELFQTSERVEMKGAFVFVRHSWEAICQLLRGSKQFRNSKASGKMRMCEQAVSQLVSLALDKNKKIRQFLEVHFDDHGYNFEVSNNRLRLFAGSVTALQNLRENFPSLIMERKFSLVNEPVVKMLGMDKIAQVLCEEPSCEGKMITHVDASSCQLRFVCTEDIKDIVEDHFHQMKKKFLEAVIDTEEEGHDVQLLEDELSHNEPVLKDKFRLYDKDGKLHVVATGDYLKLAKKKVEQMLHWKMRERTAPKGVSNKGMKLTEIQFEFIQKPEVINYIDEKVEAFRFDINRKTKFLLVYGMTDTLVDKCINDVHACLKEYTVDLSGEPVVENVLLYDIKDMLDAKEPLHHGKLLIRVDEQKKCLNIICTDDVQQAVFSELDEIKKTCSYTTLLLPLSDEKWCHIKTLFPEVLQDVPQDVRTEYCSQQGLQIMGPKEQAVQVKATISDIMEKLHVEEFPLSDDIEIFQTDEGQELIKDIEKKSECVITIKEHETCEDEASGGAIKDYLPQLHLQQTSDCIRLSECLCKGNCTITVIQGSMNDVCADVLAVPVVGREVPSAFSTDGSLKKRIQRLSQARDQPLIIDCDNYGLSWFKTKRVVFFFVPETLREGKDKEKELVRKTVQHIITQEARRHDPMSSSCVFGVETLNNKGFLAVGVKAIIRGSQETFQKYVNDIDVQLLADETMSSEVEKTLEKACSSTRQISLSQVKKSKKKFPGKGNSVEQFKPSIKIVVGRLENVEADVLVNSAHHKLDLTQGVVSNALNDASKGQLQRECHEKFPNGIQPGEVAVTEFQVQGQKAKSCHVFHGCLYRFPSGSQNKPTEDECWKLMYKFMYLCLHEASKLGVESIAFPVLGTGKLKYPVKQVANVMFTVVEWFFNEVTTSSLKTVKFVVYEGDKDIIQVFDTELMTRSYERSTKQGRTISSGSFLSLGSNPLKQIQEFLEGDSESFIIIPEERERSDCRSMDDPHAHRIPLSHIQLQYMKNKPAVAQIVSQKLKNEGFRCRFDFNTSTVTIETTGSKSEDQALQMIKDSIVEMDFSTDEIPLMKEGGVEALPTDGPGDTEVLIVRMDSVVKVVALADAAITLGHSLQHSWEMLKSTRNAEANGSETIVMSEECVSYFTQYKLTEMKALLNKFPGVELKSAGNAIEVKGPQKYLSEAVKVINDEVGRVTNFTITLGPGMGIAAVADVSRRVSEKHLCVITPQQQIGFMEQTQSPTLESLWMSLPSAPRKTKVKVVMNALEKQKADVIVNTTNHELILASRRGVSWCLLQAAGEIIQEQLTKDHPKGIGNGEVAETGPGNIKTCKAIYHGALPNFPQSPSPNYQQDEDECFKWMLSLVFNCLIKASGKGYKTIAFPALGTGTLEYPVQHVVQLMYKAIKLFNDDKRSGAIREIFIVIYPETKLSVKQLFLAHRHTYQLKTKHLATVEQFHEEKKSEHRRKCEIRVPVGNTLLQVVQGSVSEASEVTEAVLVLWNDTEIENISTNPGLTCTNAEKTDWQCSAYVAELSETQCAHDSTSLTFATLLHSYCPNNQVGTVTDAIAEAIRNAAKIHFNTITIPIPPSSEIAKRPNTAAQMVFNGVKKADNSVFVVTVIIPDEHVFQPFSNRIAKLAQKEMQVPVDIDKFPVEVDLWEKTFADITSQTKTGRLAKMVVTIAESKHSVTSDSEDKNKMAAEDFKKELIKDLPQNISLSYIRLG